MRRQAQLKRVGREKRKNNTQPKETDDCVKELVCHFPLKELFGTREKFDSLFTTMRDMVCDKPAMLSHIGHLYSHYADDVPWYDDRVLCPTHVMVTWDTDERRELARKVMASNGHFMVDITRIACFMMYRVEPPRIHILNWSHTGFDTDNDRYLPYLNACINAMKRRYMSPSLTTNHIVLDIRPIYETFVWFKIVASFQLDIGYSRGEDDREWRSTRRALDGKSLEAMRPVVANPRFRMNTTEGIEVLRLFYYPRLCQCNTDEGTGRCSEAYQCVDCMGIFYCNRDCPYWNGCYCNNVRV